MLVRLDGIALNGTAKVSDNLAQKQPGDTVALVYRRDGKETELKLQLAADRELDPRVAQAQPASVWTSNRYRLAVICTDFPDQHHNAHVALEDWEESLFSRGEYDDKNSVTGQPVHGSLHDYYFEQSCGNLHSRRQSL